MRVFTKFGTAFWKSKAIHALPDDARQVQVYFITNPQQNAGGCFALPDGYAISDLGSGWSLDRYHLAREVLVGANQILFDNDTSEVLVAKWFRHNPAMNPSHRKAIVASIEAIASDQLRAAAWQGLTDAEAEARSKQDAKASNAAAGSPLLRTPHLVGRRP